MGLSTRLHGRRVYFDAMIFIYLVEGFSQLQRGIEDIRNSLLNKECEAFTSELTFCETLVYPFRSGDTALVSLYREFIERSGAFTLIPANRSLWIKAGLYRAQFRMKTPDALHVASADAAKCDIFLTNDRSVSAPTTLDVINLTDVAMEE